MTSGNPWAIEAQGLTKLFGPRPALLGVDLRVPRGAFLSVFGPNGAGKSTLIRSLATIMRPTAGKVMLEGLDAARHGGEVRRLLGVVTHQTLLYPDLTAQENLEFYARMYDVPRRRERIAYLADLVGLEGRLDQVVGTLSRGLQQRVALARALLHDPPILLLDEPETGLDPQAQGMLGDLLRRVDGQERTVVMATHSLERGLELGDRLAILVRGRLAYESTKEALNLEALRSTYRHLAAAGE
ncbi:MAG: ABC transporter ATP-binding protein [Chloroflexi bacterium]|nr:ABC transporter ATP-binding protein [Chloroflexota bacterium]